MTDDWVRSNPVERGLAVGLLCMPQPARLSRMTQPAYLSTPQAALVCQLYPRQDGVLVTTTTHNLP
jgi:hypothetical protein